MASPAHIVLRAATGGPDRRSRRPPPSSSSAAWRTRAWSTSSASPAKRRWTPARPWTPPRRSTFIPVRHEQGAAFMADAYGRLTGKAGVCMATLGPGATNLATGIADATLDHAPMVALTGQVELSGMHKETHQFIDVVDMFKPMTKWNARVHDSRIIAEAVRKAFSVAVTEKPGATHLELPADVMARPTEGEPLQRAPRGHHGAGPGRAAARRAAAAVGAAAGASWPATASCARAPRWRCATSAGRPACASSPRSWARASSTPTTRLPVHRRSARPELPAGHHGARRPHGLRRATTWSSGRRRRGTRTAS